MESIGKAAELWVWFQIALTVVIAPFVIFVFYKVFKEMFKE